MGGCGFGGSARHVLAELLDLLDLAGQLVGKGLLERLQLVSLAIVLARRTDAAYLGLAGRVAAQAIEGSSPQRSGSAESGRQSQSRSHGGDEWEMGSGGCAGWRRG